MTAIDRVDATELEIVRSALAEDYEIIHELGRGGMAIVYRAKERELDREVAIKVLPFMLAFDAGFVERFQREARTAAQLEHPNIIPIHRVGRAGQVIYFVMKYVRGESLAALIRRNGSLPAVQVRRVLAEAASALGHAAKRGVVHRDVKPDNILFDAGHYVVTDFGIARSAADSPLTAAGMSIGTPRYMSPEQARGVAVDGRSDIYSLGIVGYECLTGRPPFDGDDAMGILMKHVSDPLPCPVLASTEERDLFAIIELMLAKRPEGRFQSADDLIDALSGVDHVGARMSTVVRGRPADLSTTRPLAAVPLGASDASGPRPSAALDHAIDIGLELAKNHRTKLDAGMRVIAGQRPRMERALVWVRTLIEAQRPRARAAATWMVPALARAVSLVTTRGARFWTTVAMIALLAAGARWGLHFAVKHRSRCLNSEVAGLIGGQKNDVTGAIAQQASGFSILLDAITAKSRGADLDVYYDVCGLEKGSEIATRVVITKSESGVERLFGSTVSPVIERYDDEVDGTATRRHRRIVLGDVPPGSYSVAVVVTSARGRRRERSTTFRVLDR